MLLDIVGTTPVDQAGERWEALDGERVRATFLTAPGGRRCRRVTRYRLADNALRHPAVEGSAALPPSEHRRELEYPAFLTFWEFDDPEAFGAWAAGGAAGRWDDIAPRVGGVRCLLRAQYELLPSVLERGPRRAPAGFNFINLVGTFVEDPSDAGQLQAWRRVYCEHMTHGVFGEHPQIKRMSRFVLSATTVDGISERPHELLPPMLTYYEFDSWDEFLAYHHTAHETEAGRRNRAGRLAWAEGLAGVQAPPQGTLLYRTQYEAIDTMAREGRLPPDAS